MEWIWGLESTNKKSLAAFLLVSSIILTSGLYYGKLGGSNALSTEDSTAHVVSFAAGFDGSRYSSSWSPRPVDEVLQGRNQSTIYDIGSSVLHLYSPGAGTWSSRDFSTEVTDLYENRSFTRNSDFSQQRSSPPRIYPMDWFNRTNDLDVRPEYDTIGQVVLTEFTRRNFQSGDNANWSQELYIDRSDVQSVVLQYKMKRWSTANLDPSEAPRISALVIVNGKVVDSHTFNLLNPTAYQTYNVKLSSPQFPDLPGITNITLQVKVTQALDTNNRNPRVYFDDVCLYIDCRPYPESVDLKLNGHNVEGSDYGTGNVNFDPGVLPYDASFTSNSSIAFLRTSSTVKVYRSSLSTTVAFMTSQISNLVSWNVNKSSILNQANQVSGSLQYTKYTFNMSIPFSWNFISIRLPSGFVEGLSSGRIDKINNNSCTWIIAVNVTAIGSYGPDPYTINAYSNNHIPYANNIATFALSAGAWVQRSFFGIGDRIMVNATLQPTSTQGSAYVMFYSASDFSVWRDLSTLPTTPSDTGVVSFNFRWADENVSRNSDLLVFTIWSNESDVGVNWRTISFDLIAPQLSVSLAAAAQYIGGTARIRISCVDDYLLENVTLLIDGIPARNWTFVNSKTLSANYDLDTLGYTDGPVEIELRGWDHPGHVNQTAPLTLTIDNTPPSIPTLFAPNDGDLLSTGSPELSWAASPDGSGSGVDHYILQLDTSPSFDSSNLRIVNDIRNTNYSVPDSSALSSNTWYWRISAVDAIGNMGAFSQARSFQIRISEPGLPIPLLLGFAAAIPTVAVLSSVIYLRRRKEEPETYDKSNLIAAYVFSSDGRALFTHQFKEVKVEPQLVSGFLTAITEMMKEVIGGDRRQLKTIERSDAKIIIEFATMVTGALVTKKASREYRRRLKAFLSRFEDDYADRIPKWDGDQSIFQAAPESIEEVFSEKAKVATYPTITGLEDLLFSEKLGGVAVSVEGKTGSGKTEFCLRYASSLLRRGKPVIVIAASLSPKDVREVLRKNDADVAKAELAGDLIVYDAYSEISGIQGDEKNRFGSPGELNNMNLALSRSLSKLKSATVFFDSLSTMIDYSELDLVVDFIRTTKAKISQSGHTAFFIIDSNAHDKNELNYILSAMDGEIETMTEVSKKGEAETLVTFKRLKGFRIKPGYHQFK